MKFLERLTLYEKLMRLDKPIGTLLLLWPTLWAIWIASGGRPNWIILWIFVLGTVLMRSAGCVINDYADRDFDPHVERTKHRPLATGAVSKKEALLLAAGLSITAFLLILRLNKETIMLSLARNPIATRFVISDLPSQMTATFFDAASTFAGIATVAARTYPIANNRRIFFISTPLLGNINGLEL